MTSALTNTSKTLILFIASTSSYIDATSAIHFSQLLQDDMESVLVHWSWVRATRRGTPIRSKLLCETTMCGMRNQVLARICTSAIYGSTQNLIRNKSVYDCYRQSLIFGKRKKSTNKHCRRSRIFAKRPMMYWPYLQKYQRYEKMPHIKFIEQKKIFCELQYEKLKKKYDLWPQIWVCVQYGVRTCKSALFSARRKRGRKNRPIFPEEAVVDNTKARQKPLYRKRANRPAHSIGSIWSKSLEGLVFHETSSWAWLSWVGSSFKP